MRSPFWRELSLTADLDVECVQVEMRSPFWRELSHWARMKSFGSICGNEESLLEGIVTLGADEVLWLNLWK